jgi:cysteine-rich repeat protein
VTSCPAYYYQVNSTCYPCLSPCVSCTAAYTCTSCISLYYLTSGNCNPCHALCLTCSASTAMDCITCVPNYILKGSICQKLSCLPYQYVQSVTGCTNCTATFPFSLACLSTGPTSCVDGYILSNGSCLTCAVVPGYALNSATGKCQDYCGDNIIITDLCDDGNNLNGDGCSSVCTIESGWTCPNNTCALLTPPRVKVLSMSNSPRHNTITLNIALSVGLRLVAANFVLSFSSITKYTYTVAVMDSRYMTYQLKIFYRETAANNNLNIQIRSPISRLLIATNSTLSLSISLSVTVSVPVVTSPPAIYIP